MKLGHFTLNFESNDDSRFYVTNPRSKRFYAGDDVLVMFMKHIFN